MGAAQASTAQRLSALKAQIAALEGRPLALAADDRPAPWNWGEPALDHALGGGLATDALHDWTAAGPHAASAVALLLALLARRPAGDVLWVTTTAMAMDYGRPYGPGMAALGLDPTRFLFAVGRRELDVAWALEEGLAAATPAAGGLAAVVGIGGALDFTASRRLSLAAARHGCPCLWLSLGGTAATGRAASSAAHTRWRVESRPSRPEPHAPRTPGPPVWRMSLTRARSLPPLAFDVTWNDESRRFLLAGPVATPAVDRPLATSRPPVPAAAPRAA